MGNIIDVEEFFSLIILFFEVVIVLYVVSDFGVLWGSLFYWNNINLADVIMVYFINLLFIFFRYGFKMIEEIIIY